MPTATLLLLIAVFAWSTVFRTGPLQSDAVLKMNMNLTFDGLQLASSSRDSEYQEWLRIALDPAFAHYRADFTTIPDEPKRGQITNYPIGGQKWSKK